MAEESNRQVAAVILAGGLGKRMIAELPKVLHRVCGKTFLAWVLENIRGAGIERIGVVIGHRGELVREEFAGENLVWIDQPEQLGTGHAVMCAREFFMASGVDEVMIAMGDAVLVPGDTFRGMIEHHREKRPAATILTADAEDPYGYGRVIRDAATGHVLEVVEERTATPQQKRIREINAGSYVFNAGALAAALSELSDDNAQGEYLLTDTVAVLRARGERVQAWKAPDFGILRGINTRRELAAVSRIARRVVADRLVRAGVEVADPEGTFIDARAEIGAGTRIEPLTVIRGPVAIGRGCRLGPMCTIIADGADAAGAGVQAVSETQAPKALADRFDGRVRRLVPPLEGRKIGPGAFLVAPRAHTR